MLRGLVLLLVVLGLLAGTGMGAVKKLSAKEIDRIQKKVAQLKNQEAKLRKQLTKTKAKKTRVQLSDQIEIKQKQAAKLTKTLPKKPAPKPKTKPKPKPILITSEAVPSTLEAEEKLPGEEKEKTAVKERRRLKFEIGGVAGFFGSTTAFLAEARMPVRLILGPATTSIRLATGLTQTRDMDRRYVPVNLDLIFNFPPGWFSGTENYIGFGVNYVALTTGGTAGSYGGQIFYGIEGEGLGGVMFGEVGYSVLRTGFIPANKGITIMTGYRMIIG